MKEKFGDFFSNDIDIITKDILKISEEHLFSILLKSIEVPSTIQEAIESRRERQKKLKFHKINNGENPFINMDSELHLVIKDLTEKANQIKLIPSLKSVIYKERLIKDNLIVLFISKNEFDDSKKAISILEEKSLDLNKTKNSKEKEIKNLEKKYHF